MERVAQDLIGEPEEALRRFFVSTGETLPLWNWAMCVPAAAPRRRERVPRCCRRLAVSRPRFRVDMLFIRLKSTSQEPTKRNVFPRT